MIGGGRSPYGSTAAAVRHSRDVTMPMMELTLTGAYGVAGLSLGGPAIATGGPLLYAGAGDLALKGYVTLQTSSIAQAGITGLAAYHLYNFATDEGYRGATISIDGGLGFSSLAYAGTDLFNAGRGLFNTLRSRFSVSSGSEFLPWALNRGSVGSGLTFPGGFKPITGFSPGSANVLKSFMGTTGDDALLGFIQNGKVILHPVEAGQGFGHIGVIQRGLLQDTGSTLGFQIIRYNGRLKLVPVSELNQIADPGGVLPPYVNEQLKSILGF